MAYIPPGVEQAKSYTPPRPTYASRFTRRALTPPKPPPISTAPTSMLASRVVPSTRMPVNYGQTTPGNIPSPVSTAAAKAAADRLKAAWQNVKTKGSATGAGVKPTTAPTQALSSGTIPSTRMPVPYGNITPGEYTPPARTPSIYDLIDSSNRRTYGIVNSQGVPGSSLPGPQNSQERMLASKLGITPEPYVEGPKLFGSQQQSKYGTFEDYQKAVDARQHGFVPNDYEDLFSAAGEEVEEAGDGFDGGGYPYYPGYPSGSSALKAEYAPGFRPNWGLWNTMVSETTWNY